MKVNGLIIPHSYNDYFSRSDPAAINNLIISQIVARDLANKAFVNSTVGTNTANYIYKTDAQGNKLPFDSVAELEAYGGNVTNNDYAFVTGTDEAGNIFFDRYKASDESGIIEWAKEYRLNNSSFTADQWAAINSGITSGKVESLDLYIKYLNELINDATPALNHVYSSTHAEERIAEANTFQPGETYGGGLTGYSFQVPGQTFSNNAQFTLRFPKSIKNRAISYSAGSVVNIICNGSSTNVISQTPTIVKVNDYAIRLQFTGSFNNNHPATLQMNSNINFN